MAFTYLEIAAGLKDSTEQGIVMQMARTAQVIQKIPFKTVTAFVTKTWEKRAVADAGFRAIGSTFAETKDTYRESLEGVYNMGGKLDIDVDLMNPGDSEVDVYSDNLKTESERYAYTFMEHFINGDRDVTPLGFDGLKKRIDAHVAFGGIGADQVIAGAGLDLAASSANRQTFLDHLNKAFFLCADGMPDCIITSQGGYLALSSLARREGLLDTTKDAFDRTVFSFRGVPLIFAGTKGDQTTPIIPSVETNAGARSGGSATSFYVVKFGGNYVTALQKGSPRKLMDDVTDDGVTHRVVFEWIVGLKATHARSAVRIKGILPNIG